MDFSTLKSVNTCYLLLGNDSDKLKILIYSILLGNGIIQPSGVRQTWFDSNFIAEINIMIGFIIFF